MPLESTPARRFTAARRWLLPAVLAILAALPAASAGASVASIPRTDQLWIVDTQGSQKNDIKLSYDSPTLTYTITDSAGIQPGFACLAAGPDTIHCTDSPGLIRQIYAGLKGGDDVFEVKGALPATVTETVLDGGGGNDSLVGGDGRNRVLGQGGRDVLAGGAGNDRLVGGDGRDALIGYGGNDLLQGGQASDALFGFSGEDVLQGQGGSDTLLGSTGDDRLLGGAKHDLLRGGKDVDYMAGQAGADQLLARDSTRDQRIDCGAGRPEKFEADKVDPRPVSC